MQTHASYLLMGVEVGVQIFHLKGEEEVARIFHWEEEEVARISHWEAEEVAPTFH